MPGYQDRGRRIGRHRTKTKHRRRSISRAPSVGRTPKEIASDRDRRYKAELEQTLGFRKVEAVKKRLADLFDADHQHVRNIVGIKIAIIKAYQRIVQVQNKAQGDVRLSRGDDVHLGMVPPNHPILRASMLEAEAKKLLTSVVTLIFTSK